MRQYLNKVIPFIIALTIWQGLVVVYKSSPLLLPSPYLVGSSFVSIVTTTKGLAHISHTLLRFGVGLTIGVSVGLLTGLILRMFPKLKKVTWPLIDFARAIPPPALIPLALLFWGFGEASRSILIMFVTSLVMVSCTVSGIEATSPVRRAMAICFGYTPSKILYKVLLPEILPHLSAGFKISISYGLVVTIVGEMFTGTNSGIGHAILSAQLTYETGTVYAYIFTIGLIGFALNTVYAEVESRYIHWRAK